MDYFVRLKPPTASIRILSIDGGGIRGIVPLETLSLLQQLIRSDCPIQELFDLAYGTSIGEHSPPAGGISSSKNLTLQGE